MADNKQNMSYQAGQATGQTKVSLFLLDIALNKFC